MRDESHRKVKQDIPNDLFANHRQGEGYGTGLATEIQMKLQITSNTPAEGQEEASRYIGGVDGGNKYLFSYDRLH